MYKIELTPNFDYDITANSTTWQHEIRDHVNYRLLSDEQIVWLFNNTTGQFVVDSYCLFFELEEDMVAFKLKWS